MTDGALYAFQLEGAPVRGRMARLGPGVADAIVQRHAYPRPVALLVCEALTLAALCAGLFKDAARLTVQAEGDGPVRLLVAEWSAGGGLRGYARLGEGAAEALEGLDQQAPAALIGAGALALTLELKDARAPMQGIAPLDGATLAACAELYFAQSEQTPTAMRLAAVEEWADGVARWRASGMLIQRVAGDAARGFTDEDWTRAEILFATLEDAELADPDLPPDRLAYRLFHEDGVRFSELGTLADRCTCTAERLTGVLARFTREELEEFVEPDGLIHASCQFCARTYALTPEDVAG